MTDPSIVSTSSTGNSTRSGGPSSSTGHSDQNHTNTLSITSHKLNGGNFIEWSQSVKLYVQGKGKFGYLSGSTVQPKKSDVAYATWEAENSMIMSWLVNSMETSLGRSYLFLPTASEIWSAVKETYSDLGNAAQLFEIKTRLRKARQGEKTVTQYYTDLRTLWQELDLYCSYEWSCPTDSTLSKNGGERPSLRLLGRAKHRS